MPPTDKEAGGSMEGPVALLLKSQNRVVLEGKKPRVLGSNRVFRLVVDVAHAKGEDIDRDHYSIGRSKWRRVR